MHETQDDPQDGCGREGADGKPRRDDDAVERCAEVVTVGVDTDAWLELRVDPRVDDPVRGIVRGPSGDPAGRVRVTLLDEEGSVLAQVVTSPSGRFMFGGAPRGTELKLRAEDLAVRYESVTRSLGGGRDVELMLEAHRHSVNGYLRTTDGAPVTDAFVACRIARTGHLVGRVGIPDALGFFTIEALPPGPYRLELTDFAGSYIPGYLPDVEPEDSPVEFVVERLER